MTENQTAMRDSNGNTVFVNKYGEYTEEFPEDSIVNRDIDNENGYTVYFFVNRDNGDYVELSHHTNKKQEALDFATEIYGKVVEITENVKGEVFEVEVHSN